MESVSIYRPDPDFVWIGDTIVEETLPVTRFPVWRQITATLCAADALEAFIENPRGAFYSEEPYKSVVDVATAIRYRRAYAAHVTAQVAAVPPFVNNLKRLPELPSMVEGF